MSKRIWGLMVLGLALCPPAGGKADVKSKLDVMFYGYVKTDVVYQQGLGIMNNFLVYARPSNLSEYPTGKESRVKNSDFHSFGINSVQSRFGFLISVPETNGVWSRGRIELDFYGKFPMYGSDYGVQYAYPKNTDPEPNKGSPMLRRATVEIGGPNWEVLAGNEWMVVSPIYPHTNNYPYGAEAGNLGYRTPQVRLTLYALDKQLVFQVAADNKIGDPGWLDIDTGRASAKPTWEFGLTYKGKLGDKPMQIGVTGHTGVEAIPSVIILSGGTSELIWHGREIATYSYNLHWIIPLGPNFIFSGEYFQGANLDGWFTGAQGQGWVYYNGDYEPIRSTGGWAELMYKNDKVEILGGYGVDDIDEDQLKDGRGRIEGNILVNGQSNSAITRNQMVYAAVNYYVNPQTMVSLEWMQMITDYDLANPKDCAKSGATPLDWDSGVVNRYTLAFWFYF